MPSTLKQALVRETARREASLNDVAVGLLADAYEVPFVPSGRKSPLPGSSPVVLLRASDALKHERNQASEEIAKRCCDSGW